MALEYSGNNDAFGQLEQDHQTYRNIMLPTLAGFICSPRIALAKLLGAKLTKNMFSLSAFSQAFSDPEERRIMLGKLASSQDQQRAALRTIAGNFRRGIDPLLRKLGIDAPEMEEEKSPWEPEPPKQMWLFTELEDDERAAKMERTRLAAEETDRIAESLMIDEELIRKCLDGELDDDADVRRALAKSPESLTIFITMLAERVSREY